MKYWLCPLLAACAAAHASVEITTSITTSGRQPADTETQLYYPGKTRFRADLAGLVPGRSYQVRMLMEDASPNILELRTWTLVPTQSAASVSIDIETYRAHPPGKWKFVVSVDGQRVERFMQASLRPPPPPLPEPPLTLVRATFTESISRDHQPRRPLQTLRLPSAVYYYVEAKGFLPNENYQVRVVVLDGANKVLRDNHFSTTPPAAQHAQWTAILPRETDAPGIWTVRMYFGRNAPASQLVAETCIEASAGGGQAFTARAERFAPVVAVAVLGLLAYIVYSMRALPPVPVGTATLGRARLAPSLAALVAVNMLPLGLAVFAGANAADILFLYWVENLVIAFYTVLRMVAARGPGSQHTSPALVVPFFLLHFGLFCTAHLGILLHFMLQHSTLLTLSPRIMYGAQIGAEFERLRSFWDVVPFALVLQVSLLLISHGLSFVQNYLKGGEYLRAEPRTEMARPYNRAGVMHVAAVATGFLATAQGSPLVMLVILVAVKTGVDAYQHLRSHGAAVTSPR